MLIVPNKDIRYLRLFVQKNAVLYSRYVMKLIRNALDKNLDSIRVFEMQNNKKFGYIPRKDFNIALDLAMKHFVDHEEYELASEAQKLLDRHKVETFLSDIK
jgi:hypothetical protein